MPDSLDRARCGDRRAFAALVHEHQRRVYSLAVRMLSDPHEAEDVAQEAFMQLYRRLDTIQSAPHLVFWLRKVTTHLAIDRLRRMPRHEVLSLDADPETTPGIAPEIAEESSDDPLLQRQMRRLVEALPPDPRAVMLLRYQEDLDVTDIARTLDMSINTVKSHLRRSLAALRKKLADAPVAETATLAANEDRAS